jgi:hypothetical protein
MYRFFIRLAGILFGLAIFAAFIPAVPILVMLAIAVGGLLACYVAYRIGDEDDTVNDDEQRD